MGTPNPSRYASTNPSLFPVLLAKILSAPNVSLSQKSKILLLLLRNATLNWLPLPVSMLNLLFPSKFALNWYMDMPMNKLLINYLKTYQQCHHQFTYFNAFSIFLPLFIILFPFFTALTSLLYCQTCDLFIIAILIY